MEKIYIARNVFLQTDCQQEIELHGYSDAHLQSYGACVYIRTVSKSGVFSVHLVASKSRHAPIKITTIPRLELLGNVLLSRLMASVKKALSKVINISNYFYWTNSAVTLAWIISQGKNHKTLVENRVQEIRENTSGFTVRNSHRSCYVRKGCLISQNSHENTCARVSFFNKVASLRPRGL